MIAFDVAMGIWITYIVIVFIKESIKYGKELREKNATNPYSEYYNPNQKIDEKEVMGRKVQR